MTEYEVRFVLEGRPVPKERPRMARNGHVYTPTKTKDAESAVAEAYAKASIATHGKIVKMVGDVEIRMGFMMPDRRRSDWDNLAKLVCDALNGVAYDDDTQIVNAQIFKAQSNFGATTVILIGEAE
jgi:Holliday junction resolvase RusA-like endonuclease